MKLDKSQYCPIHRSRVCCRRAVPKQIRRFRSAVQRIDDWSHPRGYRELRSPAEMRRLLARKIVEQNQRCGICGRPFTDCREIVPDHIRPKGMGGGQRDDHADNIQAAHRACNLKKGSRRT